MSLFLVTGGAGFIGSNITAHLISSGYSVRILDSFLTGRRENLKFLDKLTDEAKNRCTIIEGDVRDFACVQKAIIGVDYILHQAALPSVIRSVEDPQLSNDINVNGTLNILEAVRLNRGRIKKIVYAASSSAYGDTPALPKIETMPPNPLSPYALQKYVGERYMKIYSDIYGVPTVSLRYFNVFGPQQDPKSFYAAVIPKFISALVKGYSPTVHGDGEQTRDFTYIEDVIQANVKAALSQDETNGMVFNIACGKRISLNDLIGLLEKHFGRSANPEHTQSRAGDIKHSLAEISLAKKYLGYEPKFTFEAGLKKTIDYYLSVPEELP